MTGTEHHPGRSGGICVRQSLQPEILDQLSDGVAVFDGRQRLRRCNPAFLRLTGLDEAGTPAGIPRRRLIEAQAALLDPLALNMSVATWQDHQLDAALNETGWSYIHRGRRTEVRHRKLAGGGSVTVLRDLGEEMGIAPAEFLSRLAHALRTPLNVVLGYGDLLLGEPGQLAPADRDNVAAMLRGGQEMLRILNDVATWSALQAGAIELHVETVELGTVATAVAREFASTGRVRVELPAAPPRLVTDGGRLAEILRALIVHALTIDLGSSVLVTVGRAPAGPRCLEVRHGGTGINAAAAAELFKPYARVRAGKLGTGLGLAIAHGLTRRLGGRLGYSADEGTGGRFWLELPEQSGVEPASEASAPRPLPTRTTRILYVEDIEPNRDLVGRILGAMTNVQVEFAETAEEGLEKIRAALPDIVLMDINLPGMDGFEALRRLRADPHSRALPVIALTAATHPDQVSRGLHADFAAYLTKPINVAALIDAINQVRAR